MSALKSFRVSEELWQQALELAHANGETLTHVIVEALERYLAEELKK